MTKKILNKKQKIVISIVAALLIIALGVTAYVMISKKTRTTVALADVTAGDITETLKLSGTVNSENQASFEILDGTYVKNVNVRVGDAVKKGDVLATFDTSSLGDVVAQKRENYNAAMSQYRKYASNANASVAQLESLSKQIEQKQQEIEKLSEKVDAAKPKDDTKETISLKKQLTELLGDSKLAAEIVDRLFSSGTQVSEILQHLENIINGANNQISSILKLLSVSDEEKQQAKELVTCINYHDKVSNDDCSVECLSANDVAGVDLLLWGRDTTLVKEGTINGLYAAWMENTIERPKPDENGQTDEKQQYLFLYDPDKLCVVVLGGKWEVCETVAAELTIVQTDIPTPERDRDFIWVGALG